jgi:hypothetical protein
VRVAVLVIPTLSNAVKEQSAMIFINNKYTTWYNSLINKAKNRTITGYTEKHHIIPRSLGGSNDTCNLVKLTAREHFVCHLLLTKMTIGNARYKMNFALQMLANAKNIGEGRYIPSSRIYEYAKKCFKESLNQYWTIEQRRLHGEKTRPSSLGRKHKDHAIQKMKNKEWTKKALENRLNNCLKSAEARKGSKWSDGRKEQKFEEYIAKNKHLFPQVFELFDNGTNIRQISITLKISWDRVKYILDNRDRINNI